MVILKTPLISFLLFCVWVDASVDLTLVPDANGSAVVHVTIEKVQDSCIFDNDYQFLRRIAWVESKFGGETDVFNPENPVGMWRMSKQKFDVTTDANNFVPGDKWQMIVDKIRARLGGIEYESLDFAKGSLRTPLHAAIAQRFFWQSIGAPPITVDEQAAFWKRHYATENQTTATFTSALQSLPPLCQSSGADVLFILDSSGSIGEENWKTMTNFTSGLVTRFALGQNSYRFAVDQFSDDSESVIAFNRTDDPQTLAKLIRQIPYTSGGTRTDLALYHAIQYSYTEANGARPLERAFPRVVLLVTDGQSNEPELTVVAQTAAKQNGLLLFTIGIGAAFDSPAAMQELSTMASRPKCLHMFLLEDFNALLNGFPEELKAQTCRANAVVNSTNETSVVGELKKNEYKLFQFAADTETGIRFVVNVTEGITELYVSQSVRNPSEVVYDFKAEASVGSNGVIDLEPNQLVPDSYQPNFFSIRSKTAPVYASIKGIEDTNSFKMHISRSTRSDAGWITIGIVTLGMMLTKYHL